MANIQFFFEGVDFKINQKRIVRSWIKSIVESESFHVKQIDYIFCDDLYLLNINNKYLNHDYYTDVITFDYSANKASKEIESDIFISLERVWDNSCILGLTFTEELYRVMSHGVLHLMGYKDKSETDLKKMRLKELECVSLGLFHVEQVYKKE